MIDALYLAALFCAVAPVLVFGDFSIPIRLGSLAAAVILFLCWLIASFRSAR